MDHTAQATKEMSNTTRKNNAGKCEETREVVRIWQRQIPDLVQVVVWLCRSTETNMMSLLSQRHTALDLQVQELPLHQIENAMLSLDG